MGFNLGIDRIQSNDDYTPVSGEDVTDKNYVDNAIAAGTVVRLPSGHIFGLVPSNNGSDPDHDLDFSPGECRDSSDTRDIVVTSAVTKRADATWAAGSGNGGMASGVTFGAGTFHCFVLGKESDPEAFDFGFDTDVAAANLLADSAVQAAGFDIYREVARFQTLGAAWPSFTARAQAGGALHVRFNNRPNGQVFNNPGTAPYQVTIAATPPDVDAVVIWALSAQPLSGPVAMLVTETDAQQVAPNPGTPFDVIIQGQAPATNEIATQTLARRIDGNRQLYFELNTTGGNVDVSYQPYGWVQQRV